MIFIECQLTENIGRRSRASLMAKVFSWPKRYVNKCEKNSPENRDGQQLVVWNVYTEPKRAHYEEQFEHNEKVGRRICRCHLPISKIVGDDFGESDKNQPRLLFESSVPRGKTPEDKNIHLL